MNTSLSFSPTGEDATIAGPARALIWPWRSENEMNAHFLAVVLFTSTSSLGAEMRDGISGGKKSENWHLEKCPDGSILLRLLDSFAFWLKLWIFLWNFLAQFPFHLNSTNCGLRASERFTQDITRHALPWHPHVRIPINCLFFFVIPIRENDRVRSFGTPRCTDAPSLLETHRSTHLTPPRRRKEKKTFKEEGTKEMISQSLS